jgi:hypothetical protein
VANLTSCDFSSVTDKAHETLLERKRRAIFKKLESPRFIQIHITQLNISM